MIYPGYLLNPGDMFQVDIERVMFATGKTKEKSLGAPTKSSESGEESAEAPAEAEAESSEAAEDAAESAGEPVDDAAALEKEKEELKALRERVKTILEDPSRDLSGKQKKALRGLAQDVKSAMSRLGRRNAELPQSSSVVDDLTTLFSTLDISSSTASASAAEAESATDGAKEQDGGAPLTSEERERLDMLIAREAENPYDPSKPYMTPWRPRPYMSPFAFIPRYLEVNQNICAAVYLRHPVARQGAAEVPTPFPHDISQLAFNWYLRRR